ncbi:MAG: RecQ family ATP-dependent DNA helicase [Desulfobulbaceae bacterium]|nr:RecQ family ATP-dependent DNA helicase [Desulfobulbaceae bacterium]
MTLSCRDLLRHCLLLDIEVNERNEIYSLGAVLGNATLQRTAPKAAIDSRVLEELDNLARDARFMLGHNIINHDLPRLKQVTPNLQIFTKPAIDTLFLSPLAYPANPYHRLVKNYQIVRDSINDPVQDALLAAHVFTEQWDALVAQFTANSDIPLLYRSFLAGDEQLNGTAEALACMGIPLLSGDDLHEAFSWFARKHACSSAIETVMFQLADEALPLPPLAYVTAWLSVAGGNSVLPPWVRHQFPQVPRILHQLREYNCGKTGCDYCQAHHSPLRYLQDYYGFSSFRAEPATADGESLQEQIVLSAARGNSIFATLPTGGGKSLCYLLSALMRYHRRNTLTIVISPLQALMKDQVDNFSRLTGTKIAAALYGMLTMPERSDVMEGVRLGDIGILLVSPEQLRNNSFTSTISQREIGAWVFDEAHCLSKWGHDFRPDYLYAIRFIREFAEQAKTAIPPVQCFTATAKKDVRSEILDIMQRDLGIKMELFAGGHERTNLHYEVWEVDRYEKNQTILELLRSRYENNGSAVIYCATRNKTEQLAEFLQQSGYTAEAFHAGLEPSVKKRIQDSFIAGTTPIICATNAFGMGIDKEDVRIVIHADIPGSLENYLQEAGRAGRDRNAAECILIFNEQDIEGQFRLSCSSMLSQREIAQFLRGIRYAARGENSVVLTAGDLIRLDVVEVDPDLPNADTRVRTALAWLERAGYLQRNENQTKVFQGKPTAKSLTEAAEKIATLNLSERQQKRWLAILGALMELNRPNQAFSADELAGLGAFTPMEGDTVTETETQRVIRTLHDMASQGVLEKTTLLSAYLRYKVQASSEKSLQQIITLENEFLSILVGTFPDMEVDTHLELDLRQVNQKMIEAGHENCAPHTLKLLLYGLSRDGKGLAGAKGSVSFTSRGNNRFSVYLHRDWQSVKNTVTTRQLAANRTLEAIIAALPPEAKPSANLLVQFSLEQIVAALRADLLLLEKLKDPLAAAERALTFMHEQGIIDLQQGLAVFRQAMTIQLHPEARSRRYSQADFSPLKTHYSERTFQIHVMNEFARLALSKISGAWQYVASYFNDDKEQFVKRFFPGKESFLERATSEQSYQRIVDDLKNPSQEKIVTAPLDQNLLILAGPGAGKTRVVAHRVAYLIRVKRVPPRALLVLCFNRSAIMSLRQRVRDLVGEDMAGVTMLTFHGLALRFTGRSLVTSSRQKDREDIDFSHIIKDAIGLLKGEKDVAGFQDIPPDYALIGRFSHILVDEYQDIDAEQYELVSLVAGKSVTEHERKMTILAVGDDDQNIYRFRGASVEFIKKFRHDYDAHIHYLIENYRSTAHIIDAANCLIAHNTDRMKTNHPIRINRDRKNLLPGGNWQANDPVAHGKVQLLQVSSPQEQAAALLTELKRLQQAGPAELNKCAVLAREWKDLDPVRSALEAAGIPVCLSWGRQNGFPRLSRIREHTDLLDHLHTMRTELLTGSALLAILAKQTTNNSVWSDNLKTILQQWRDETNDAPQPVPEIQEYLYETFAEQNRAKTIGNGLFLATAHSVKGLEFDHVFILGDNWDHGAQTAIEDERRLYYVSMSRARETLHLFSIQTTANPHASLLAGDFLTTRKPTTTDPSRTTSHSYHVLGMEDLFLDYIGIRIETHPSRQAIKKLQAGDRLNFKRAEDHVDLINEECIEVARLSKKAFAEWEEKLDTVQQILVLALVRRTREDVSDKEFQARCIGQSWEIPIVEFRHA